MWLLLPKSIYSHISYSQDDLTTTDHLLYAKYKEELGPGTINLSFVSLTALQRLQHPGWTQEEWASEFS